MIQLFDGCLRMDPDTVHAIALKPLTGLEITNDNNEYVSMLEKRLTDEHSKLRPDDIQAGDVAKRLARVKSVSECLTIGLLCGQDMLTEHLRQ